MKTKFIQIVKKMFIIICVGSFIMIIKVKIGIKLPKLMFLCYEISIYNEVIKKYCVYKNKVDIL